MKKSFYIFADEIGFYIDFFSDSFFADRCVLRGMGNNVYCKDVPVYFIDGETYSIDGN